MFKRLATLGLLPLLLGACAAPTPDAGTAQPGPSSAASPSQEGQPPAAPDEGRDWTPQLKARSTTLYYSKGTVPAHPTDRTSAQAGTLVMRGECRDGSLTVIIGTESGTHEQPVTCDGSIHEAVILAKTVKGEKLSISTDGTKGTRFAIELSTAGHPAVGGHLK